MPQRDRPRSRQAGKPGDDFEKIAGIGPALAQRLHKARILTYEDLAGRTPDEIAAILSDVAGVSPQRIANQDWTGQARQLAGTLREESEPSQHYASFHIELLLDADNRVRRTKVHHHQADTVDTWPGWDEDRLLGLVRDRVPLNVAPQPTDAADFQPPVPSAPFFLRIEELAPIRDGQAGYVRDPHEATSVRLTLRVKPTDEPHPATVDFAADIAARKLGGYHLWQLGARDGTLRIDDPVSVELTGPPLPPGLYRLVVTVVLYAAGHAPEAQPLYSRGASGDLMQVAEEAPIQTAPAGDLRREIDIRRS